MEISLTGDMQLDRVHLNKAAKLGQVEAVKQLIQREDIPPNADEDLEVLLGAIREGQEEVVKVLLSHDRIKNINFHFLDPRRNPLNVALTTPYSNISFQLWKNGAFAPTLRYLQSASQYGHPQVAKELLKNIKCSLYDETLFRGCLETAIENKQIATATILLKSKRVLIDPLGFPFSLIAAFTLIGIIMAVALIGITTLIAAGIVLAVKGAAVALSSLPAVYLITKTLYPSIVAGLFVIASLKVLGHHLFVLARATALIAYHHFSQKATATAKA